MLNSTCYSRPPVNKHTIWHRLVVLGRAQIEGYGPYLYPLTPNSKLISASNTVIYCDQKATFGSDFIIIDMFAKRIYKITPKVYLM